MNLFHSVRQLLPTHNGRLSQSAMIVLLALAGAAGAQTAAPPDTGITAGGPVRLRQPSQAEAPTKADTLRQREPISPAEPLSMSPPSPPGDFETYVQRLTAGNTVRRYGHDLLTGLFGPFDGNDYNPLVPPDYVLRAGDELVVTLWGSVDADLRLQVDRSGRISIPRVGPIMVSGVRYADLPDVISRRVALVFKNFQLSVTLGQLRGLRVYVTGFVAKPGSVMVSSLSTLAQALMRAGGPSAAGSFRNIQLRRGNGLVTTFDLYDLLQKGDRSADQPLQADDVILVGPVGTQVALIGSINRPAVFELKPGETLDDLLRMGGGFSAVADSGRLTLERFSDRASGRLSELPLPQSLALKPSNGDVLRALNAADITLPTERQNKRVRIEGEVQKPGEYVLPPTSTLGDALRAAGGPTAKAYLYATSFTRESVRVTQQQNYDRALRDLETQMATNAATRRTSTSEEAASLTATTAANSRFLEQLRTLKPTGRIVLQLTPTSDSLPDMALEDGDRLQIPSRPTTVGVFGSVFSTGSYLHSPSLTVGDFLRLAGGPTRGADDTSVFVIRANGTVSSSLQESGFFSRGNQIAGLLAEPGDTIFVPEELNRVSWIQSARDWTQILYQFGLGAAALRTLKN